MANHPDNPERLRNPWLVAVWPGMGGVAQIAGSYLVRQLDARRLAELDAGGCFEPPAIVVKDGLVQPVEPPHTVLYGWRNPDGDRDLLILLAERQPTQQGYSYCESILEAAARHGVERVFTFAAMASDIRPEAASRIFAACTRPELLAELKRDDVSLLGQGEIAGLNGVLLAAATARGLPGTCLLGEFPFFAAAMPNPKASAAVLRVFGALAGLRLDLADLDAQARNMERNLLRAMRLAQSAAEAAAQRDGAGESAAREQALEPAPAPKAGARPARRAPPTQPKRTVSPEHVAHLEQLFARCRDDRSCALELKAELDRLGVFKEYEDRFLDLFRKAG